MGRKPPFEILDPPLIYYSSMHYAVNSVPMSSGSLRSGDEYITPTLEAARIMGLTCPYFVVGGVPTRFKLKTQI